jgi:hypothetical protein
MAWTGGRRPDRDFPRLDGRFVFASASIRNNSDQVFGNSQQLFRAALASATAASLEGYLGSAFTTLSSSVSDPRHLFGAGTISTVTTVPSINEIADSEATGVSSFGVSFFVDRQHAFDFSGVFTGSDSVDESGDFSSRTWEASLIRHSTAPDSRIFSHRRVFASGTDEVREEGLIPFGEYTLLVEGIIANELKQPGSTHGSREEFAFMFDLSAIPEPGSLVLLGSGAVGLLGIRRHRSTQS